MITPDGRIVSDNPTFLKKNPTAMTWKHYQRQLDPNYQAYFVAPTGHLISEDPHFLRKNKNAMTWSKYQKMLANKGKPATPVD